MGESLKKIIPTHLKKVIKRVSLLQIAWWYYHDHDFTHYHNRFVSVCLSVHDKKFWLEVNSPLSCCIKIGTAEAENLYAALAIKKKCMLLFLLPVDTTALLRQMFHFSCNRRSREQTWVLKLATWLIELGQYLSQNQTMGSCEISDSPISLGGLSANVKFFRTVFFCEQHLEAKAIIAWITQWFMKKIINSFLKICSTVHSQNGSRSRALCFKGMTKLHFFCFHPLAIDNHAYFCFRE